MFNSKRLGVPGTEITEIANWREPDPITPSIPAADRKKHKPKKTKKLSLGRPHNIHHGE
jgi:hypothetical protein